MRRTDTGNGSNDRFRREFLRLTTGGSIGVMAGLAGCTGESNPSNPDETGTGDGETASSDEADTEGDSPQMVDKPMMLGLRQVPSEIQFNPYNQVNRGRDVERIIFDPLTYYSPNQNEFIPVGAQDWSVQDQTMTITLNQDLTWHDGDPVRAKDLATQFTLAKYMDGAVGDYVETAEATGEKELSLTLTGSINKQVVYHDLLTSRISVKHEKYADKLNAFEEASGDDETTSARKELAQWKVTDPVGNGPFQLADKSKQQASLTKHEQHPSAGEINFPRIQFKYLSSDQQIVQAVLGNDIDAIFNLVPPGSSLDNPPEGWKYKLLPGYLGLSLAFQQNSETFSQRKVRKAIAHLIDPEPVIRVSAPFNNAIVDVPDLLGNQQTKEYVPEGDRSAFNRYEVDSDKAASLLQDAGYSKQDGTWVDSSGEPLHAPIKYPAGWSPWVSAAQNIVSQLKDAGINAEAAGLENSSFFGQAINGGNFELALFFWGTSKPYPYFNFDKHFSNPYFQKNFGVPETVSVPEYATTNGGSTEVNVAQKVETLAEASEKEQARQIIAELAWVGNQDLPVYPLMQKQGPTWYNTNGWNYPPKDGAKMNIRYPQEALLRLEGLSATR